MRKLSSPKQRSVAGGLVARLVRFARGAEVDAPSGAEARHRIHGQPGFYASLGPEARSAIESYAGPEVIGPPRQPGKR
ncbi:MAG TPA: hypothetical protein VFX98_14145 [Longimicrobiaceae bacterium]|nr:hypothetical protein [Longimicrobiaceae bacterium]